MTGPTPKPEEPPDDDEDDLPITLPVKPSLSRFGPAAIDYAINQKLSSLIPKDDNSALFDIKLKGADGERLITGIVAARLEHGWGLALGGALDLDDRRNYEVELVLVKSWK